MQMWCQIVEGVSKSCLDVNGYLLIAIGIFLFICFMIILSFFN